MKKGQENKSLLRRYIDNLYTTEDAQQFLKEVQHPETFETLNELTENVWKESASEKLCCDLERERYKKEARQLLEQMERKSYRRLFRRACIAVASVAAVVCLVFGAVRFNDYQEKRSLSYVTVTTSYGEKKSLTLPDGTQMVLNSCSKVRYPDRFIGDKRNIKLEGEGYFQVTRNEKQPFVITTSRFGIRVLGTSFNVKSYPTDELVSVNVESGKVQVDLPEAMMRLRANEQVCINTKSGNYTKEQTTGKIALWRKGTLCFNQTPIRDVAKELERIYNCTIVFGDGDYSNLISGEHDNASLEAVLRSIEYTSGIHYRKEKNHILLYK